MTHAVQLRPDRGLSRFRKGLTAAARAALAYAAAPPGELSIRLMEAESIRVLNAHYAGEDRPTDVLSFASPADDPARAARYFGDIALAVPVAQAQADRAGHPVEDELALLTVHGVLHLLGYDHAEEAGRRRMWAAQAEILGRLRLATSAERLAPS